MCRFCQTDHAGIPCPVLSFRCDRILCLVSAEIEKEKEPLLQLTTDLQVLKRFVGVLKRLSIADVRLLRAHPGLKVDEFCRELVRTGENTEQEVTFNVRRDYDMVLSKLFFAKDLREFHTPEIIARLESDPLSRHPFVSDQFMIGLRAPVVVARRRPVVVKLPVKYVVRKNMKAKTGDVCPVCLEDLDSETVCTLTCNHQYCSKCLSSMVENRHSSCGLCRVVFKSAFVPNETVREEVIGFAVGVARTMLIR